MNIEAPRGFVLIRDGGEVFWHKGISGNQFDEAKLQRFKNDNENSCFKLSVNKKQSKPAVTCVRDLNM
ncbi:unnamed protein product, partial [Fusarium fujikuroi]